MVSGGKYIYLLMEREFLKYGEDVFKIGRSENLEQRMKQYPNGSAMLMACSVRDDKMAEKAIQKAFEADFVHRKDIGREYFEGKPGLIFAAFNRCSLPFMHLPRVTAAQPVAEAKAEEEEEDYEAGQDMGDYMELDTESESAAQPDAEDPSDPSVNSEAYEAGHDVRECVELDMESEVECVTTGENEGGGVAHTAVSNQSKDLDHNVEAFFLAHKERLAGANMPMGEVLTLFENWSHTSYALNPTKRPPTPTRRRLLASLRYQFGVREKASAQGLQIQFLPIRPPPVNEIEPLTVEVAQYVDANVSFVILLRVEEDARRKVLGFVKRDDLVKGIKALRSFNRVKASTIKSMLDSEMTSRGHVLVADTEFVGVGRVKNVYTHCRLTR
jgi:hypothetical protein